jgi:dihydroorotate dehydrogenase electron transfer subunit
MVVIDRTSDIVIQTASVVANRPLCREHLCLTFSLHGFPSAQPGQFVHLRPETGLSSPDPKGEQVVNEVRPEWATTWSAPLLRRAFSIAGLRRGLKETEVDVIYRAVGAGTRWMESLQSGGCLNVMGPLGNAFPIHKDKPIAWLVAGGVGLPPMLWLAEALDAAGISTVAFCGARTADLLPLTLEQTDLPPRDASRATAFCREFAEHQAAVVISTDDGTLGYHGPIGQAVEAYHKANPIASEEMVVYTCGPERMMQLVAGYCLARHIECHVCVERRMACGTGLCQSCVVPVHDQTDPTGWRYQLCCNEGPVFDAGRIIWEPVGSA